MKAEDEAVSADEQVLRLIHPVYYKADLALPIQPEAFRPLDSGETGLSVFRLDCLRDPLDALTAIAEGKRSLYYIACLAVADLKSLGLSVQPEPVAALPGHAIIPELNTIAYHQDKVFWKQVQRQLAELASRNIVHRPGPSLPA